MIVQNYLKRTNSFVRFLLVGVVNTFTGLSMIFLLLHILGAPYWTATFIGNTIGAAVSYFLNKNFTFSSDVGIKKSAPRFVVVILVCYFIAYSVGDASARWISEIVVISETDVAVLLGAGLYTLFNYFGQKFFVFQTTK